MWLCTLISGYIITEKRMEIRTHLGNAIEAIDSLKARYDKNVKELLADIQVLSRIVKHTVTEVESLSIQEIMDCIDRSSIRVGVVPVEPGDRGVRFLCPKNLIKYNTCEILLDLIRHFPADIQGSMLENPLTYQDN